jgi:hypothetical protein
VRARTGDKTARSEIRSPRRNTSMPSALVAAAGIEKRDLLSIALIDALHGAMARWRDRG